MMNIERPSWRWRLVIQDGVMVLGILLLWRRMVNTEDRGYGDTWMVGRDG